MKAKDFYDTEGWDVNAKGVTKDAELWEDLREIACDYVSKCRLRVAKFLPARGDRLLDAASGPLQYPEYLQYSKNFNKHICFDISQRALDFAAKKLGPKGEFVLGDVTALPFEENLFDAVVSLHTIYHVEASKQAMAVNEFIRVAKAHAPIIIVYSNRWRLLNFMGLPVLLWIRSRFKKKTETAEAPYFHTFSLHWWNQFRSCAEIQIYSWRFLTADEARVLIPNNALGRWLFSAITYLEDAFPKIMGVLGAYPVIVLKKRS